MFLWIVEYFITFAETFRSIECDVDIVQVNLLPLFDYDRNVVVDLPITKDRSFPLTTTRRICLEEVSFLPKIPIIFQGILQLLEHSKSLK